MSEIERVSLNLKVPFDLANVLDQMVKEDDSDRSKFIRRLIRKEHELRIESDRYAAQAMKLAGSQGKP